MRSIFNLFVLLNRDTCLLTRRGDEPLARARQKFYALRQAFVTADDMTKQRIFMGAADQVLHNELSPTPFYELKVFNFQLNSFLY